MLKFHEIERPSFCDLAKYLLKKSNLHEANFSNQHKEFSKNQLMKKTGNELPIQSRQIAQPQNEENQITPVH
jgi:hypothetical protein